MKLLAAAGLLCLTALLAPARAAAQAGTTALNHIALYVVDLRKSTDFYRDVLLLQEIPEPFHDGKHTWFRIGPHAQLHVIQGNTPRQYDINTHLAFSVPDLAVFRAHLAKLQVPYRSWKGEPGKTTPRPDGVEQVYLQDPDGFWLEVNDDKF